MTNFSALYIAFLLFFTITVHAKTITIPTDADNIQRAVEQAVSGDVIVMAEMEGMESP